jgi:endonuclease/exonuclease/phosphatase family metal-dependent hydrolase
MIAEKSNALPVILVGDFNCLPDSTPYEAIIAQADKPLLDARQMSMQPAGGPNSTWCGFKKIAPNRIIDHVFVGGPIEVESLTVLNPKTDKDRFGSDHLPVQIVATISKAKR